MLPIPLKRRKRDTPVPSSVPPSVCLFPDTCVFLVERRMGAARRSFLTSLAQRKGFCVMSEYSEAVTHVVSEQNSCSEVLTWIENHAGRPVPSVGTDGGPHLLDIIWFTESMSCGKPVEVEPRHCLGVVQPCSCEEIQLLVPPYSCQRQTPLNHHNHVITNALEVLAEAAFFQGSDVRSLGFTRAMSTIKAVPFKLRSAEETKDLPWCGGHCKAVIEEILEDGVCREVEKIQSSEQYQVMKLLTGIFGVGVHTAERWYKEGIRKLGDLKSIEQKLTAAQQAGLRHYTDLQKPVTRKEADYVENLVTQALQRFLPDVQVTMTGGFRRGKQQGHDVDFLITHPDEGALTGLLKNAVDWLESKGLLLYHNMKRRSNAPRPIPSSMDGHETCYTICALPTSAPKSTDHEVKTCERTGAAPHSEPGTSDCWRAVRVDLVVTPYSEYPFALLGWTGSKHFERELRRYSLHEKKMSLNSHWLYDTEKKCNLPARSEEEIFSHLGLQYILPAHRNA
ncbi:DNA-directed DNA/RNA polymerase mu-like [Pelodytes ibericus]